MVRALAVTLVVLGCGCGTRDDPEGFVHDGDRGCEPLLPEEPCPPGLMAVPGECYAAR